MKSKFINLRYQYIAIEIGKTLSSFLLINYNNNITIIS